jgi:hypothetical protein
MKFCTLLSVLSIFLFTCNSESHRGGNIKIDNSNKSAILEKLDSIQIDYLGNFTIHDINPEFGSVLFLEDREFSQQILLADFHGNLTNSFSKFGDMPDTYGALMGPLKFLDNNRFLALGYNGFMIYDFEGNLLSRTKLVDFVVPSRSRGSMGYGMEKQGNRYLYIDQGYPPNKDFSDIGIYEDMFLLNWLYPETGVREPFIQFPETSIFKSGNFFFRNAWDPVYTLVDGLIYVVFGLEPMIYVYEANAPYSLLSSLPLDLPEYQYFKGTSSFNRDINFFGLRFTSGFIENIKKVNNHYLVGYFPGYNDTDTEIHFSEKSIEETAAFNARMTEKYPHHIAIFDSLGRLINNFIPGKLDPKTMVVRNGELWMLEKPDEDIEQDYFRLFRVGLKVED